jgi:hypothetical protein
MRGASLASTRPVYRVTLARDQQSLVVRLLQCLGCRQDIDMGYLLVAGASFAKLRPQLQLRPPQLRSK